MKIKIDKKWIVYDGEEPSRKKIDTLSSISQGANYLIPKRGRKLGVEKIALLSAFPKSKKYDLYRKVGLEIVKNESLDNFKLAKLIEPHLLVRDYKSRKKRIHFMIKGRLKIFRKYWKHLGYDIKFDSENDSIKLLPEF